MSWKKKSLIIWIVLQLLLTGWNKFIEKQNVKDLEKDLQQQQLCQLHNSQEVRGAA